MTVVYLLADGLSEAERTDIKSRLLQRSVAVWADLERLPPELERAARKMALRHSSGVVIWGDGQRHRALREMLLDAREARCRLIAVAPNPRLVRMAPEALVVDGEDTSALIDGVCGALEDDGGAPDWTGAAADFARSVGDRRSLEQHLQRHPDSPFAALASAELRRGTTKKFRFTGAYAADVDWSADDLRSTAPAEHVWRTSAHALRGRSKRLASLLLQQWHLHKHRAARARPYLAAIVVAAIMTVILPHARRAETALQMPSRVDIAGHQSNDEIQGDAPHEADLGNEPAPREEADLSERGVGEAAPLAIALSPVVEAAPVAETVTLSALQPASRLPEQTLPSPAVAEPMRAPFDLTAIDPAARRAVERARRDQERAIAAALQARTSRDAGRFLARHMHNGALYDGQAVNGVPEGEGRAVWPNRDRYAGNWQRGRPHGFGVYRFADGRVYEGAFSAGAPTGEGVFWDAEAQAMTGEVLFNALVTTAAEIGG